MAEYRFTSKGFHHGSIVEAGEVVTLRPGEVPGAHMVRIGAPDPEPETITGMAPMQFTMDKPPTITIQMPGTFSVVPVNAVGDETEPPAKRWFRWPFSTKE